MIAAWLLLQIAVLAALGVLALVERLGVHPRGAQLAGRAAVLAALCAPALLLVPDAAAPYEAPAKLWSATEPGGAPRVELRAPGTPDTAPAALTLSLPAAPPLVPLGAAALLLVALQLRATRRSLGQTTLIRRLGALELRAGDVPGPFALWWPGRCVVVLDEASLLDPATLRMSLRHEVQHHRSGDTRFAWVLAALRLMSWPNPAGAALWRRLRALDELACDAALVEAGQVEAGPYAHLLLAAAARGRSPLGAVGLHHPTLLRRRILMLTRSTSPRRLPRLLAVGLPMALVLGLVSLAEPLAADMRPNPEALEAAAASLEAEGFEASLHPDVLALAEQMAGNPEGRARLEAALERRAEHEAVAAEALARHGVPLALLAVPLVESGWRNLPASANPMGAAGLWQFIPPTAKDYGLVVEGEVDERLDPALASDAAARLLADLHHRFDDWGLALAAYNVGAQRVELAMKAQQTRDVHALIASGALPDYANAVYAAALLGELER
ncbi:MAG: transglycosylase SLT domain-containing protein [Alphaproteobacteria bacterium]|nr:transglycosylase SLT domain-containing protein [Alphaproteobacteria bacterium]MCB9797450.1 transglycosylase SLT domain-containing protein [Alphaproteobacteria bacterium]